MKYFIFRNMTIERFFGGYEAAFSGYEDISYIDQSADRYVWFYMSPLKSDAGVAAGEIANYTNMLKMVISQLPTDKMLIVFTMLPVFTINSVTSDRRLQNSVDNYNYELYANENNHVKVVDFAAFLSAYSEGERMDWKYYFISQMALNPRLAKPFKAWFDTQLDSIALKRKKCLVLDLDNTLWGGILGEDGIQGIKLGGDYPGKAFLYFQHYIEELGRQGIILAVCSKNNMTDVEQLWKEHPDNILNEKHFAICKVNWTDKASNIKQIAEDLNIGTDSMVFFDDNPTERALIKEMLPEVTVPDFPEQPYELPMFIKEIAEKYFAVYSLTNEDLAKTEQYKANAKRNDAKTHFANMTDYLRSLKIELEIREINNLTLTRVAQMTQKTNQFNLTTRRYTDSDITKLIEEGAKIYTLSVGDKFGDNGITGCCIVKINNNKTADIDSLLLSCRILGKGIETEFVYNVLNALKQQGIYNVSAQYIPTSKNTQTADFYDKLNFVLEKTENDTKFYSLELDKFTYKPIEYFKQK